MTEKDKEIRALNNLLLEQKDQINALVEERNQAIKLLEDYNQWEADIINEDKLWWPNRAKDVMSGHIYDTMMELQGKRNNLLELITPKQ